MTFCQALWHFLHYLIWQFILNYCLSYRSLVLARQSFHIRDQHKLKTFNIKYNYKLYEAVPLQTWIGLEDSRKLWFSDFMTTAQDSGKVVSLTHRPPLPQEIHLVLISVRGWVDPRAIVRPEGLCHWKILMTPSGIKHATCLFVV